MELLERLHKGSWEKWPLSLYLPLSCSLVCGCDVWSSNSNFGWWDKLEEFGRSQKDRRNLGPWLLLTSNQQAHQPWTDYQQTSFMWRVLGFNLYAAIPHPNWVTHVFLVISNFSSMIVNAITEQTTGGSPMCLSTPCDSLWLWPLATVIPDCR